MPSPFITHIRPLSTQLSAKGLETLAEMNRDQVVYCRRHGWHDLAERFQELAEGADQEAQELRP